VSAFRRTNLSKEEPMRNLGYPVMLAALMLLSAAASAHAAGQVESPEISPGSISAGLALLSSGVLLVRARRSK
jgi:uncharacterized protein (TIGR03382 family)